MMTILMVMVVVIFQTPESEVKPGPAVCACTRMTWVSRGGYDDGGDDISDSRK